MLPSEHWTSLNEIYSPFKPLKVLLRYCEYEGHVKHNDMKKIFINYLKDIGLFFELGHLKFKCARLIHVLINKIESLLKRESALTSQTFG